METLFWASALLVAYVYAGYPLLLVVWSAVATRPVRKRSTTDSRNWPSVSVIVAAHNEAARLPRRVTNLLEQVYPHPFEIIVVSDGSTDDPRSALAPFAVDGIILMELPRGGKPAALNAGIAAATGDIVVFADARQIFTRDSILHLVANFSDPNVGGVTGELILDAEVTPAAESTVGDGVGLYWRYEKWLRRQESRIRSTLGATGALYALRRELWSPLPTETLLDDVLAPMRVVLAGHRVVFEERAQAFDRVSSDGSVESRRKTRTLAGNYQILLMEPRLLIPFVNRVWVQYVSHKIGRLLVPWALLTAFIASAVLAGSHWAYFVALILQLVFYGLAVFGAWIDSTERPERGNADEVKCRPREPRVTAP